MKFKYQKPRVAQEYPGSNKNTQKLSMWADENPPTPEQLSAWMNKILFGLPGDT